MFRILDFIMTAASFTTQNRFFSVMKIAKQLTFVYFIQNSIP